MQVDAREFVERMTLPVWQAAAAVRWLEGRVENRPKGGADDDEKAALSDADCVSQEILLTALYEHFPGLEVDAEEDTPALAALAANRSDERAVVDPIDGSLRYLRGDGLYAIIVGLERAGRAEAAVVAVPQEQVLVRAVRGGGAELSYAQAPFRPARPVAGARVLVSHHLGQGPESALARRGLKLQNAAGGAVGVAPLLDGTLGAIRISHRHEGLSRRAWIAGLPTLEAGGALGGLEGPFPEIWRAGERGVIVAPDARELELMREAMALR